MRWAGMSQPRWLYLQSLTRLAAGPNPAVGQAGRRGLIPVSCYEISHVAPLRFYIAVERGIARRIGADRHYVGVITKNPLHPYWRVEWRRDDPYALHELADWLFFEDMRPDPGPDTMGAGRNAPHSFVAGGEFCWNRIRIKGRWVH
jgi:Replicase family